MHQARQTSYTLIHSHTDTKKIDSIEEKRIDSIRGWEGNEEMRMAAMEEGKD